MRKLPRRAFPAFALAAAALLASTTGQAQTWPARPVAMVVAAPAGGVADNGARIMARILGEKLGQPVVVENRPGANGIIGTTFVARARPDGYTVLYGVSAALALNPITVKNLTYESPNSFTPLQATWESPLVLVVHPDRPYKTFEQFLQYARANPGKVQFGSVGTGSNGHLTGELFQQVFGIKVLHVPYKGSAQAAADLMAGHVDATFDYSSVVKAHVDAKKLLALVQTGSARMPSFPDIATVTELGYPQASSSAWAGFVAPAGLPPDIAARLTGALKEVLKAPEVVDYYTRNGSVPLPEVAGDRFRDYIAGQITGYRALIQKANIQFND